LLISDISPDLSQKKKVLGGEDKPGREGGYNIESLSQNITWGDWEKLGGRKRSEGGSVEKKSGFKG